MTTTTLQTLDARELIMQGGALRRGHCILNSTMHSDVKVDMDVISTHPILYGELCRRFAEQFAEARPDMIIGPASGAILMTRFIAMYLSRLLNYNVLAAHTIEVVGTVDDLNRELRMVPDDVALLSGRRVIVVDDVATTGGSLRRVAEFVKTHDGKVRAAAVFWNRGDVRLHQVNAPELFALVTEHLPVWAPERCRCRKINSHRQP